MSAIAQALTDKDFLAAHPDDQKAYLSHIDPDFAKGSPQDQGEYLNHILAPTRLAQSAKVTQFEKDRPGGGTTVGDVAKGYAAPSLTKGMGGAALDTIKSVGLGSVKMLDPTSGLSGAALTKVGLNPRSGTVGDRLREVPIVGAAHEMSAAYHDPNASAAEVPLAGAGALVGESSESARQHAARGESGAILGEAAVPAALAIGGPVATEGIRAVRPALRSIAYKELPTTGGPQLTRGARSAAMLAGSGIGAVGGSVSGIPGGAYIGGHTGLLVGPSMMENIIGKPEMGDIRNPGPFSKIPNKAPKSAVKPAAPPSPFEGMSSSAGPKMRSASGPVAIAPPIETLGRSLETVPEPLPDAEGRVLRPGEEPLIQTPEEFRAKDRLQGIAKQRASERGMQYAGGVRPAGPNKVANALFPQQDTRLQPVVRPSVGGRKPVLMQRIPQTAEPAFKGGINPKGLEMSMQPITPEESMEGLSSEIARMKDKLRNANGRPETEKVDMKRQIDEYQQRLDDLRGAKPGRNL